MAEPTFASPILINKTGNADTVEITDESARTKILVHADMDPFGVPFGSSGTIDEVLVCGTRPQEWLLIGNHNNIQTAIDHLDQIGETSTVDITHGQAMLRITGLAARKTLEKICSMDWSDLMTPDGAVVSASVAKINADIIRNDQNGEPSYLLAYDRSLGQYLYEAVLDATTEFTMHSG